MGTRILLDENITDYKKYLQCFDLEIFTVEDIGMKHASDLEIVKYAKDNECLFISKDSDAILTAETMSISYLWVSSAFIAKAIFSELSSPKRSTAKKYSIKEMRKTYPNAYELWSEEEDEIVLERFNQGIPIKEIAMMHGRNNGAIRSRLKKLGIIQP